MSVGCVEAGERTEGLREHPPQHPISHRVSEDR